MTELFETVECEKVAASRDHSRIKIYIHSDRLIAHKAIRETERAIRSQMFKDQVDVCLVEKYHLSRQYTPASPARSPSSACPRRQTPCAPPRADAW